MYNNNDDSPSDHKAHTITFINENGILRDEVERPADSKRELHRLEYPFTAAGAKVETNHGDKSDPVGFKHLEVRSHFRYESVGFFGLLLQLLTIFFRY